MNITGNKKANLQCCSAVLHLCVHLVTCTISAKNLPLRASLFFISLTPVFICLTILKDDFDDI